MNCRSSIRERRDGERIGTTSGLAAMSGIRHSYDTLGQSWG